MTGKPRRVTGTRLYEAVIRKPELREALAYRVPYRARVVLRALCEALASSGRSSWTAPADGLSMAEGLLFWIGVPYSAAVEVEIQDDLIALHMAGVLVGDADAGSLSVPVDWDALRAPKRPALRLIGGAR